MAKFEVLVQENIERWLWVKVHASSQAEADEAALDCVYDPRKKKAIKKRARFDSFGWEVNKGFRCLDCGCETIDEYPLMLVDDVWLSIVPGGDGMLCQRCMEERLGRELTQDDLLFPEKFPEVAERSRRLRERRLLLGLPALGTAARTIK